MIIGMKCIDVRQYVYFIILLITTTINCQVLQKELTVEEVKDMYDDLFIVDAEFILFQEKEIFSFSTSISKLPEEHILSKLINENGYFFSYILKRWSGITKEEKTKFFKDSKNFPGNYYSALKDDKIFNDLFLMVVSNYLSTIDVELVGFTPNQKVTFISLDDIMDIAVHFFYPSGISERGNIISHVCVGINGLKDMEIERNPLIEAFAYFVINQEFEAPKYGFLYSYTAALDKINKMNLSRNDDMKLSRAQGALWYYLYQNNLLRNALENEFLEFQKLINYKLRG